jgi:signal transduction histidine kinase/ABC-type amino acid transport substrate-binding protein
MLGPTVKRLLVTSSRPALVRRGLRAAVALIALAGVLLCAASGPGQEAPSRGTSLFAADAGLPLPSQNAAKSRRVVIFGGDHDGAPMEYIDSAGRPAGFNIDLLLAIGEAMNLEIHFILGRWSDIRRGILGDSAGDPTPPANQPRLPLDVAALYYLPWREPFVDFTSPLLIEHSDIFVRRKDPPKIDLDHPGDFTVAIMRGGYTQDYFSATRPELQFALVDAETEALRQLNAGQFKAAIVGQHTGRYAIRAYGLSGIRPEGKPFLSRDYCLAVRKGDQELRDILNEGLEKIRASGKYEEIYQRWFVGAAGGRVSLADILHYLILAVVPLVAFIALVLAWNWSLKKQVASRTADLSRELVERRLAEQGLRESESRFRELSLRFGAILGGIPHSITLLDAQGGIVWTDAAGEAGGRSANKPTVYCCRLARPRLGICPDCIALAALRQGKTLEARYLGEDGRTLEIKAFPLRDQESGQARALVMTSDITENVLLQQEAMRASHLASLGELSAGVAHEVNNPNGLILLNLPFLEQFFDEASFTLDETMNGRNGATMAGLPYLRARQEVPRVLTVIRESARRIRRIVEDLRNFARPAPSEPFAPVDLREVITTALRLTENTLRAAGAVVRVDVPVDAPFLRGNRHQLEQVMVNLLLNAGQALDGSGREIAVSVCRGHAAGPVVLEVRDQGRGMSAEVLAHATDPFFTTRRERGGTGLGLSMSARIVKEHKGEMRIRSAPGQGASILMIFAAASVTETS